MQIIENYYVLCLFEKKFQKSTTATIYRSHDKQNSKMQITTWHHVTMLRQSITRKIPISKLSDASYPSLHFETYVSKNIHNNKKFSISNINSIFSKFPFFPSAIYKTSNQILNAIKLH